MMDKNLILSFIIFGSTAQAAEFSRVKRPSYTVSFDASQADILSQIDTGVKDINPSLTGPNWVIYPEDQPKIGVVAIDRKKTLEPKNPEEANEDFGVDPDLDEILVQ